MQGDQRAILKAAAAYPARVRERAPRVHCLTNHAAAGITANMLLAIGAIPSLTDHPDELPDFVGGADALMINLGTPDQGRVDAVANAIGIARRAGVPWVLDPVMCDRGAARLAWSHTCLSEQPDLVRLNEQEAAALSLDVTNALGQPGIIALTGRRDRVMAYERPTVLLGNGDPLMGKVTAIGCGLSAVAAAFMAVSEDRFMGTMAGLLAFGVAGEIAGRQAAGPGSFPAALLDALHNLDAEIVIEKGRLE